ncbi:MAG: transporter, partial [Clostridia bacterium]|nr:transporter [Clostridia bacterium]
MAYFFVIIAAILWGTLGIFGKKLTNFGFEPTQMVLIRSFGATITLILFASIKNTNLLKISYRDSIYFVGTGIISFVFCNWCYFVAINKTSLSIAAILLYSAPTIVMVLSAILFKEKITKKKIISLMLTFAGCIFVTAFVQGTGQKITMSGLLAGVASGFGYALYSIFGRYALKKYDSITVTLYTFIFASIGLIPITDVKGM